jgi:hypothetical protein
VCAVDLIQSKYLQYGNGELRISCIDLSEIKANSDVTGERYYGEMKWTDLVGDNNEAKVGLSEV